jgi:UDP-2,3-diacylglucosamine hydrolase
VRNLTYFISDLHLGASYIADPRAHERLVVEWLQEIAPTARRLYLVGDVLDYWYEYRDVVPRGYVRFFGALAALADSGVEITWLIGNHDIWIFDYLPQELGIRVVDGVLREEIDGVPFVIAHGDGLGKIPRGMRLIRALFRNRLCQWLYAAVHPRWTVGLAHSWSAHNRRSHKPGDEMRTLPVTPLLDWVKEQTADAPGSVYVFGHYHVADDITVRGADGIDKRVILLGDWIKNMTFSVFNGEKNTICQKNIKKSVSLNI